jgi:hypothetical protein
MALGQMGFNQKLQTIIAKYISIAKYKIKYKA